MGMLLRASNGNFILDRACRRRLVRAALTALIVAGFADTAVCQGALSKQLAPLGRREKIRFFWTQWRHFNAGGVSDEQLMASLAKVGANVFADGGFRPKRARLAHAHGIHYFCGFVTAKLREPAREIKSRLAVDKGGKTCPQRFADYVAAGGDPHKPWGSWGEGKEAYVPCPLLRDPWDRAVLDQTIQHAREGLIDGLHVDLEPYGAYGFDQPGAMLCILRQLFRAVHQDRESAGRRRAARGSIRMARAARPPERVSRTPA